MANIALQDGKVILKDGKVSCSCCEAPVSSCGCFIVSGALKAIIDAATTVSVNGTSDSWDPAGTNITNIPFVPSAYITYSSGVLCITADNGDSTSWLLPDGKTVAECQSPVIPFPPGPDTMTVNGNILQAVNWFGVTITPTPNIVFT
jgi:hypothetical protein